MVLKVMLLESMKMMGLDRSRLGVMGLRMLMVAAIGGVDGGGRRKEVRRDQGCYEARSY